MISWLMLIGIILIVIGGLGLTGIMKFLPNKKYDFVAVLLGVLMVSGIVASLVAGFGGLAIANGGNTADNSNTAPNTNAFTYSVLAVKGNSNYLLDENAKVITIPETFNSTATSVNYSTVTNNFTISIKDSYSDMRSVGISCTTTPFYNQNVTVSDSTLYTIVSKATDGTADIRIYTSALTDYQRASRTFLLGGQSSAGQSVTLQVSAVIDATAVSKLSTLGFADINCNVAGQAYTIAVEKVGTVA